MKTKVTAEEERQYTVIIDEILANADLNTISAKAIRRDLQLRVNDDIAAKKVCHVADYDYGSRSNDAQKSVTDIIMKRFDVFNSNNQEPAPTNIVPTTETSPPAPATNGASASPKPKKETNGTSKNRSSPTPDDDDDALSSAADSPPPSKRTKIEKSQAESDAEYARRLQAELNRVTGRSTRGGGATTKRKPAAKQQRKKKSKARVGSDDDSDAEGGEKKEVKRTGGFHVCPPQLSADWRMTTNIFQKPLALSAQLSALLNETQLSRPQTVKKIWEYIRANNLQDPSDKRQIICDDQMRSVFKSDKVHMFTMNKIINTHLYPVEEVAQ